MGKVEGKKASRRRQRRTSVRRKRIRSNQLIIALGNYAGIVQIIYHKVSLLGNAASLFLVALTCLHIKQICSTSDAVIHGATSRRNKRRGLDPSPAAVGRTPSLPPHLGLHFPDEAERPARRTEHHPQPRAR